MKKQEGVTLTALVAYMGAFMIIIGIVTTISTHFYKNIGQVQEAPQYIVEFNKFSMFFIADVKRNTDIKNISNTYIEFGNGTTYEYRNGRIYRNNEEIAKNIKQIKFTSLSTNVNDINKKMINVTAEIGKNNETITRNIDFVLKYW